MVWKLKSTFDRFDPSIFLKPFSHYVNIGPIARIITGKKLDIWDKSQYLTLIEAIKSLISAEVTTKGKGSTPVLQNKLSER